MAEVGIRETRVETPKKWVSHTTESLPVRKYITPSENTHPQTGAVTAGLHTPWLILWRVTSLFATTHGLKWQGFLPHTQLRTRGFPSFDFLVASATLTPPQQSRSRSQFRGHVSTAWRNQCGLWTDCCCFSITKLLKQVPWAMGVAQW